MPFQHDMWSCDSDSGYLVMSCDSWWLCDCDITPTLSLSPPRNKNRNENKGKENEKCKKEK